MTLTAERPPAPTPAPVADPSPRAAPAQPAQPLEPQTIGSGIALSLALAGALVLGFVVFLFGFSSLSESRAQHNLVKSFTKSLGEATAPVGPATEGNPVAVLNIPAIGVHNMAVVEGTSSRDLMSGPGHLPNTPIPGQVGVSTIMGKQTTFGGPFAKLLRLNVGDLITVYSGEGTSTYKVSSFGNRTHPAPLNSPNALLLETADPGWWPNSYSVVTANLTSQVGDTPGQLPGAEKQFAPMARDVAGSLIPLAGWSQVLLLLAIVGTVLFQRRATRVPAMLCVVAIATAVLWNVYENAAGLLPNLM